MAQPRGHMFYIGFYSEKYEKILSETTRTRALIFGMTPSEPKPSLFYLYTSIPGAKNGPPRGHMFYIGLYREKHETLFLSETIW